jgi:PAS domain S-box-containing protein
MNPIVDVRTSELETINAQLKNEIAERKRVDAMVKGQNKVLRMLARGHTLTQTLDSLILSIENQLHDVRCSILLRDEAKNCLMFRSAPSFPKAYREIIDELEIGPQSKGCALAAHKNEMVIVEDIAQSTFPNSFKTVASTYGFRACWSIPINGSSKKVLGTLCLYYKEPQQPTEEERQLVDSSAHLTGIAIERKRDEEALRESEERFRKIFESGPLGIAVLNTSANFVRVNEALCQMTGFSEEEMLQLSCNDLTHPDYQQKSAKLAEGLIAGKYSSFKLEKRYLKKNGLVFWVNMTLTAIRNPEGEPLYIIGMYENITDRKLVEEELQNHRDHLEELVAKRTEELSITHNKAMHYEKLSAVGKLAASVAHEFNNPLYGICNVLNKVQRNISLDEKHKGFVDLAIRECERVTELTRKLQDFNRPSSGIPEYMDLHLALDDMIGLMDKQLQERKIKLTKNYSSTLPLVEAVPDQIRQVILNLLQNAGEAVGGEAGEIVITTDHDDDVATINFQDNGSGIASENIKNIFDPFFTTKSTVKGTGLGLSTSYGIIMTHQGKIETKSLPGQGSEFTVTLPIKGGKH